MKKKLLTIIFCLIILLLACAVLFNNIKKDKNESLKTVKVSEVTHSIFYTPMYVADALGYFEDNGIDVEIITSSGADAVAAAVLSGDVDIGFCGSEQTIYIYNQGEKDYLINFAGLTKRDGSFLVGRTEDNNFDLNSLKGKTIIGGRKGGMPSMTLAYTLYENGIDPYEDVTIDTSIAFASMSGAFISGTGDYVTLFEPSALQLEKQGFGNVVASIGKLGGEVPYTTFNARKSFIENNPETIEAFTNAIQKGIDYTFSHNEEELADIIIDYFTDASKKDLIEVIKRYKDNDSWYKTTYITEDGWNRIQNIMEYNKVLDSRVDYKILVDNTYSNE